MNSSIQLNNDAIQLLSRSSDATHMQQAIALFTQSLRSLKTILVAQEAEKNNSDYVAADDDDESSCCSDQDDSGCSSLAAIIDCPCGAEQPQCPGDTPESNFVYKRMFRLFAARGKTLPSDIRTYIACVIFNLALLHQHQASTLELGVLRTSVLEKSALLYKSCFQILLGIVPNQRQKVSTTTNNNMPFDDVTFLLKVGALNNSAQILYESEQYEQACNRLGMVESILCQQELSETQCCFTVQEFEGLLSNVLLLKPPTVAVAA
jgi:hypothetical protein